MGVAESYAMGRAFAERLGEFERPLWLLAHHDDEITLAGLLSRLAARASIVWVTNSDGRYFDSQLDPPAYAEVRKAEGARSAIIAGLAPARTRCLGFSEVEIYRRLSRLHAEPACLAEVRPFFDDVRLAVERTILELEPDLVVSLAWQGGQPEHDLTHLFGRLAIDRLAAETGRRPLFLHFPAYEYTYALAARFHPLYRGARWRIRLEPAELETKLRMVQAYPSQVSLFRYFRWAFRYLFWPLGLVTGGPRTIEQFMAIEEFGPVPDDLDYRRRPHSFDFLTYMFDDFEGVPVTFDRSIRPLVDTFYRPPGPGV